MINTYIHNNKNTNSILKIYFLSLTPLIIYGIYKNGILLYQKNVIGFVGVFKPLIYVIIPLVCYTMYNFLTQKKFFINFDTFSWVCLGLFVPPSLNVMLYLLIVILGIILQHFLDKKFNVRVLTKLVIVLTIYILGKYSYMNNLESITKYAYNFLDILWGRSVGGVFSTSVIYTIICLLILNLSKYYKNSISIISILLILSLDFIRLIFVKDINIIFLNISGIMLAITLFGAELKYSPYTNKGKLLYSIVLGLLTFVFSIFLPYEGVFIAILILSATYKYFDKFIISLNMTKK